MSGESADPGTFAERADRSELARAVGRNTTECFAALDRLPEVRVTRAPDCVVLDAGIPYSMFNGIFLPEFDASATPARIAEIKRPFTERSLPLSLWLGAGARPDDLRGRLGDAGFRLARTSVDVAFDASTFRPLPSSGLEVRPVRNERDFEAWFGVFARVFGLPESAAKLFHRWGRAYGFGPELPFQNLLGEIDGRPAAVSTVFFNAGIAGLFSIGTLPELRRRRFGTDITQAAIGVVRERGCRYVVGTASEEGMRVYRKAGILELGRTEQWLYDPRQAA